MYSLLSVIWYFNCNFRALFSAEENTGSSSTIALIAAIVFMIVAFSKIVLKVIIQPNKNFN